MTVFPTQSLAPSGIPGIDHVTLAGNADGLRKLSIWKQSVAPGSATPPHRHDCEEVVLCSGGIGELHIGGNVERFGADMTVVIPANADHQIFSVGDAPLEITAVFSMSPVQAHFPSGEAIDLPWRS
jgi:mannose-6-phosphate isomerase-like protein (cupin superfamily)